MSRRALMAFALLAACGGPAAPWSQAPGEVLDLELAVSPTQVRVLEPVTVQLDLWRRDGVDVDFAPSIDGKDFAAETSRSPEIALLGGRWQRVTMVLRAVRGPGELVLPPFVAKSRDGSNTATTPETKITVVTALEGQSATLEAPADPFPPPTRLLRWIGLAAAILVVVTGTAWFLRRRRRPTGHADEVAVPPHVKALRALARLREAPRRSRAEVDAFYVEVSNVLRNYLEERFGLRAPERTTEEFLRELERGDGLAREHRGELERFLLQCDLVKFAAFEPGESDHLVVHGVAVAFVESTRPDRGPAVGRPAEAVHA